MRCFYNLRVCFIPLMWILIGSLSYSQPLQPSFSGNMPIHFVRTWDAKAPESTGGSLILSSVLKVQEAVRYFDGLGRPSQTVVKKGALATNVSDILDTSGTLDLGTPVLYDTFNRLKLQKDEQGNILKKYCYNYAGQPIDCN
jgi:hypothetical protein